MNESHLGLGGQTRTLDNADLLFMPRTTFSWRSMKSSIGVIHLGVCGFGPVPSGFSFCRVAQADDSKLENNDTLVLTHLLLSTPPPTPPLWQSICHLPLNHTRSEYYFSRAPATPSLQRRSVCNLYLKLRQCLKVDHLSREPQLLRNVTTVEQHLEYFKKNVSILTSLTLNIE